MEKNSNVELKMEKVEIKNRKNVEGGNGKGGFGIIWKKMNKRGWKS